MPQFDTLRSDALTVSRIRRLLRPLEVRLNTLARILNKHYAMPEAMAYHVSGATYSKKHRLRGFVATSARRGPKAWASLYNNHPLASVYGFLGAIGAVQDAFYCLVYAVFLPKSKEPLLSLQAITSKMIGRHIAEETLGRSAASEEEEEEEEKETSSDSEADVLGDWYEEIPIHCRRWGPSEAIQVDIDSTQNFQGCISRTCGTSHHLQNSCLRPRIMVSTTSVLPHRRVPGRGMGNKWFRKVLLRPSQSSIFLEHIVQYYFSPHKDSNDAVQCPINEPYAAREITQLYNSFTKRQPAATFFKILFSVFYELEPTVWTFRAVSHLYRHIDQDFNLSILFVNAMARHLSFPSENFQISDETQVLEKLISRTHDLIQRFPDNVSATSHDLLLDLAEALGTLVNSRSADVLSTEIGEALLTLCLMASLIKEARHSEILHPLNALEKVASPRIFTTLVLRTSLATFGDTTGCWLSILRSHHLVNLAKALEDAVASFHAGDVPRRRPYKRKRKASSEPGPGHDSDEWDHREGPGRGKTKQKQTKVEARNGTPSESSVSWLEDSERQGRAKGPRIKVTYQPSEESGSEHDPPVHASTNGDSSEAYDQDEGSRGGYKPLSRSTKKKREEQPLESSREANARWSTSCQPPATTRGHLRSRSKIPLPRPKQVIESSQSQFATSDIRPAVSGLKSSSTLRQETHPSSDDDLNLFACSSPQ